MKPFTRTRRGVSAVVGPFLAAAPVYAADPPTADLTTTTLDTVSVTASRVARSTRETPGSVAVIDETRIESEKMFNIKEAIRGIPGVLIDSKNGGYDVRLVIRGAGQKANYGVREIMVLRDGVPMTDPDSFSRFDYIDPQDIERIEITKGPGSLYGAGAAGGTLQIISRSVFDPAGNRVKLGLGEFDGQMAHFRLGGEVNESNALSLTASYRSQENDWRKWNEFDTTQVSLKHGLRLEDDSTLETELSYSKANMQLPATMTEGEFEEFKASGKQGDTVSPWQHNGRYSNIIFFNSRLEKSWGDLAFKPRLYYNHWDHYHPVTGSINDNPGTDVAGGDLEFVFDHVLFGPSTLVSGVTGRLDDTDDARKYKYADVAYNAFSGRIAETLSDRSGDLLQRQSTSNRVLGVYLQETVHPREALSIDVGFRFDHSDLDIDTTMYGEYDWGRGDYVDFPSPVQISTDKTFNLFSPRIGLTYEFVEGWNAYALFAQSDQLPSDNEIIENPGLDASTATNFEIGLKGRGRDWSADMALYRTEVKDEIVSVLNGWVTEFENAGETLKIGFEAAGQLYLTDHLQLEGGYAYSDYTFEEFMEPVYGVGNVDRSDNQIPYIPRHQYSLALAYDHPAGFKARLAADSWGSYYMDNANTEKYEGYDFLTSLMLGYEAGPHSLTLNVDNLFDKRYAVEVKKNTSGVKSYYAGAPRSTMLTYRYTF